MGAMLCSYGGGRWEGRLRQVPDVTRLAMLCAVSLVPLWEISGVDSGYIFHFTSGSK